MRFPTNSDDIINSEDVRKAVAELEGDWDTATDEAAELWDEANNTPEAERTDEQRELLTKFDTKEACINDEEFVGSLFPHDVEEYHELQSFWEEMEHYVRGGATLINEDHFVEYAKQYAEDLGRTKEVNDWPYNHIDWDAAADELKSDHTTAEFGSTTYYYIAQ